MKFEDLRVKHPQLIYESFEIKFDKTNLKINFNFKLYPGIEFRPEIIIYGASTEQLKRLSPQVVENLVFNLGMVELLSYWKAACPPEIIIKAGFLDKLQINFWQNLLVKGMGEFFYVNQINFTDPNLVKFVIQGEAMAPFVYTEQLTDRDLILVGGGKDSALTLDILGRSGREFNCLCLNPVNSTKQIIKIAGCMEPIFITRIIDPKLLELNKLGYLNGHTPFSAYLAFLSILSGVIFDYKNLVVSNESSSNEGNVNWLNQVINHQYSKTFEFENLFKQYCKSFLSENSNYFSFLRPLNELQIAKLFASSNRYFNDFRSCNKGSKTQSWCGVCPKCVSTYISLYPFIGDQAAIIFGKNLLLDNNITPVLQSLLGTGVTKPFECVATFKEMKLAVFLCMEYAKKMGQQIPPVLQQSAPLALNDATILKEWNSHNNLPEVHKLLLESKFNETN